MLPVRLVKSTFQEKNSKNKMSKFGSQNVKLLPDLIKMDVHRPNMEAEI